MPTKISQDTPSHIWSGDDSGFKPTPVGSIWEREGHSNTVSNSAAATPSGDPKIFDQIYLEINQPNWTKWPNQEENKRQKEIRLKNKWSTKTGRQKSLIVHFVLRIVTKSEKYTTF